MKKKLIAAFLAVCLLLSACSAGGPVNEDNSDTAAPTEYTEFFAPVEQIDHCVLEPDDRARLTEKDAAAFRELTEGMLSRRDSVTLSPDTVGVSELLDLLRESPYYFFVDTATVNGDKVSFTYAYSADEQNEMLSFIDAQMLRIADFESEEDDNALDVILKIYLAVTHEMTYDSERTDNKELGSPLFTYPADEIYKALRDHKSLCYGFAYVMRFALLQRGIDCFCVYGQCTARGDGHEWIIFRYGDNWYHCDPAWDRVALDQSKLIHFGKTDREREVDTLVMTDFSSYHDPDFGEVTCTDETFMIFRGMKQFCYSGGHRYTMADQNSNIHVFDTEAFDFVK